MEMCSVTIASLILHFWLSNIILRHMTFVPGAHARQHSAGDLRATDKTRQLSHINHDHSSQRPCLPGVPSLLANSILREKIHLHLWSTKEGNIIMKAVIKILFDKTLNTKKCLRCSTPTSGCLHRREGRPTDGEWTPDSHSRIEQPRQSSLPKQERKEQLGVHRVTFPSLKRVTCDRQNTPRLPMKGKLGPQIHSFQVPTAEAL